MGDVDELRILFSISFPFNALQIHAMRLLNTLFISLFATKTVFGLVSQKQTSTRATHTAITTRLAVASDIGRPATFLDDDEEDDINITFINEGDIEEDGDKPKGEGRKRWENLNPKIKQRLIEKGQEKAIANKKKREPARDKKRSEYLFIEELLD